MKYYLLQNGKEYGPYDMLSVLESIKDGGIPPQTQIRKETQSEWKSLETIFLPDSEPEPEPEPVPEPEPKLELAPEPEPEPKPEPKFELTSDPEPSKPEPEPAPAMEKTQPPSRPIPPPSAKTHRAKIRARTAYGALRGSITFATFVLVIAIAVSVVLKAVDKNWEQAIYYSIPIFVLPAIRAFLFAIIDIADTLLEAHREK